MPRKARKDPPGALHHIICRGIERRKIFRDNTDRNSFIERFGRVILETQTPCFTWALISNHFHLLLKTGNVPITMVMRKLLTGYAVSFNRRHRRVGHLFQSRYKSILCQEDFYLLKRTKTTPSLFIIKSTLEELVDGGEILPLIRPASALMHYQRKGKLHDKQV